jgi:hypothetical protein
MAILEDFHAGNPDLQPWDPRIKSIAMLDLPAEIHGGYLDAKQFVAYLHCKRKIGCAITTELLMQATVGYVMNIIRDEMQPLIDAEYKKLQEMAGGAVDLYGQPIKTIDTSFVPLWDGSNMQAISTGVVPAQMTPEEQFKIWIKQAKNSFHGEPGFVFVETPGKEAWTPMGWTADGVIQKSVTTGDIVRSNLLKMFPGLKENARCPVCEKAPLQMVVDLVIHLNDTHKWTRMQVADWTESLDIDLTLKEEYV